MNYYKLIGLFIAIGLLDFGCKDSVSPHRRISIEIDAGADPNLMNTPDMMTTLPSIPDFETISDLAPTGGETTSVDMEVLADMTPPPPPQDQGVDDPMDLGVDAEIETDQELPPPSPPVPMWGLEGFPWFFSIHSFEVDSDLATSLQAFDEVITLGGSGVRTDILWREIEPTRGVNDVNQINFYTDYFRSATERGLTPLAILSNPPEWAISLYRSGQRDEFWAVYESYVRLSVLAIRDYVDHYQLWNEPNHLIDIVSEEDDWELIHRAGVIIRELDPTAMLAVNAMTNILNWEDSVTRWIQLAGDEIDVIGIDHYPGTWACCDYSDWTPLETLIERINDPADVWYGKAGAVMETGFSSWAFAVADEGSQETWINESLTRLHSIIEEANRTQENRILFGNYYQLIDVDTDGIGQEAHFGIVHSDFTHKQGYFALQSQLQLFSNLP